MNTNDIPKAHPSLLDALRRQDEKAGQMHLSEGFEERVMTSLKDEGQPQKQRIPERTMLRRKIHRIAAVFLIAAFLGTLAWAIAPHIISHTRGVLPVGKTDGRTLQEGKETGTVISFSNLRLDSILTVVSAHYGKAVCFRDTAAQTLRLSTIWDSQDSLAVFIATLNEFDGLSLTDERDTIFVEAEAEEGE